MEIFKELESLRQTVSKYKDESKSIGFVPTMGALHQGHISLVREALKRCDVCIVSIFVNPTQFNDPKDLETYPRTLETDCRALDREGVTAVFAPSVEVIYPQNQEVRSDYPVGKVAEVMEGKHRPGHFSGVMQVVQRLFELVEPNMAFFGQKDFQQVAVVRTMCRVVNSPVEIVDCPIVREEDGLAMSSRNVRLSSEQRLIAPEIYKALRESRLYAKGHSPKATENWVVERINAYPQLRVEYFSIVDATSLEPIASWDDSPNPRGCIAVYCGDVRLIDNISYQDGEA